MDTTFLKLLLLLVLLPLFACGGGDREVTEMPEVNLPELTVQDGRAFEQTDNSTMLFEVFAQSATPQDITLTYSVEGITAEPGVDFMETSGSVVMAAGSNRADIEITIIDDAINEVDEKLSLTITASDNAPIKTATVIGIIKDNDDPNNFDEDGYTTPNSYFGYTLEWQDEFDGENLNLDNYNFDLGDGCPNLCGWGNNELEWYTDEAKNIFLEEGRLVIRALQEGGSNYTSAKIHTKDKRSFQFGRIDIRAKLPKGQGLWPAIWMLGNNIDEVGWPACGEIDIMELVGHEPNMVHGTAHWGAQGSGNSIFKGSPISQSEDFSEQFHVFSLVWEPNLLTWYMDETAFHTISPADTQGQEYRFNAAFYMIFNVAVGGNWPGNPDATTVFPQQMEVDYVRYFK